MSSIYPCLIFSFLFMLTYIQVLLFWYRKDSDKVTELFDAIEKIKDEFKSIERPKLELENPTERSETPPSQITSISPSPPSMDNNRKQDGVIKSPSKIGKSQIEIELDKLSEDDSAEEISEWEFDALDKDRHSKSWITWIYRQKPLLL